MDKEKIIIEIKKNINEKIRPILVNDGGNIEFVDYDNETGIVKVKLLGHCHGCPYASITLKSAVQEILIDAVPEITKVEAIDFNEEDDNNDLEF